LRPVSLTVSAGVEREPMSVERSSDAGGDPQRFTFDALPGRVVFGAGVASEVLVDELERLGGDRVLVISTPRGESLARELAGPLGDRVVGVFTGVRQHVPVETAQAARLLAAELEANAVVCVGGGSAVGTAKAVALTTGLPIMAVPTTYAGSEVTPVWGLTDAGRKTTGVDPAVQPRTVIYDPELTRSLPPRLAAVSGLNAMAHSIEAFWAPGRNPVSSAIAERSIRALAAALPAVVVDPSDQVARGEALLGAWLAGVAFAVAGSGLHHKICHVLGGAYGLPHAETHAIVLPHVLAFNAPAVPAAADRIAAALGADDPVAGLVRLSVRLDIPVGLRSVGLDHDVLDEATDLVLEKVPADNPRPPDRDALAALLEAAWSGLPDTA
jgi:maleylacetate reductase